MKSFVFVFYFGKEIGAPIDLLQQAGCFWIENVRIKQKAVYL